MASWELRRAAKLAKPAKVPKPLRTFQVPRLGRRASRPSFRLSPPLPRPLLSPMPNSPDLTLPLAQPITLTRGPRSHLVTLMDAAILIRDLEPFPGAVGVGSLIRQIGHLMETMPPCPETANLPPETQQWLTAAAAG